MNKYIKAVYIYAVAVLVLGIAIVQLAPPGPYRYLGIGAIAGCAIEFAYTSARLLRKRSQQTPETRRVQS